MQYRMFVIIPILAFGLAACSAEATPSSLGTGQQASVAATVAPTTQPTAAATPAPAPVIGIGIVAAAREVDLNFTVTGTVAEVLARRGDLVSTTQLLARLDGRKYERQVRQLEAALQIARAQAAALTSPPNAAAVAAAKAQVRQAEITLTQTRAEQTQDGRSADSIVTTADISLQDTRDRLSASKTTAELTLQSATSALGQAQTDYSVAKRNWQIARDSSKDPITPSVAGAEGESVPNKLSEGQRQQYFAAFVQAESALHNAEASIAQAQVAFDNARQAEVTGIQQAEQQVAQAQIGRARQQLPAEANRAALAQAALDAARANLRQLFPAPSDADRAQAAANTAQAEANLAAAQIDLESIDIRAPFAGIIADVSIDPGDFSGVTQGAAVRIADTSTLHIDVRVSDLDVGRVREGQAVRIMVEGMPSAHYGGKVRAIAPTATTEDGRRTFLVEVTLDEQASLRPGMSARVEFATGKIAAR